LECSPRRLVARIAAHWSIEVSDDGLEVCIK
jgi:hypothetical protein